MGCTRGVNDIQPGGVLALGFFDGLHRGHGAVLDRALTLASHLQCRFELMTFYPHPDYVNGRSFRLRYLTTYREKLRLFRERYPTAGFRFIRFDRSLMNTAPGQFLEWLDERFSPRGICVGEDFRFGVGASGDTGFLQSFFRGTGVRVVVVRPLQQEGTVISSSRIRQLLSAGGIEEAARLLGYSYQVSGRVRQGKGIGRTLGFPTVNIHPPSRKLLPGDGVYRGEVTDGGLTYPALVYVGTRPTLGSGGKRVVEAYLRANLRQDLYHRRVAVLFQEFIRGEMVFSSLDQLKDRISVDLQVLERYLHDTSGMLHYNLNVNTMGVC